MKAFYVVLCLAALSSCASLSGGPGPRSGRVPTEFLRGPVPQKITAERIREGLERSAMVETPQLRLSAYPLTEPLVERQEREEALKTRIPPSLLERKLEARKRIYTLRKLCFRLTVVANDPAVSPIKNWDFDLVGTGASEKLVVVAVESDPSRASASTGIGCVLREVDLSQPFQLTARTERVAPPIQFSWEPSP